MIQPIRLRSQSRLLALLFLFLFSFSMTACSSASKWVKDPNAEPEEATAQSPRYWPMLLREVGGPRR